MVRHASGIFVRNDRVRVAPATFVRLLLPQRRPSVRAVLIGIGSGDVVINCPQPLTLGSRLSVALTLPGRYIELELPGSVEWENGSNYGISFDYLSARQAYGVALAREVLREPPAASRTRALRRARG